MLGLAVLAAGLASIATGRDANWDLLNYHRYNPWGWLNGRYGFDVAPAQLQTFHNRLADVPFHLMVAADWPPRAIAFAMAIPAGIAVYLVYRIARLAFADREEPLRTIAIVAALVVGVTGPNARSLIGSTMNEWLVAAARRIPVTALDVRRPIVWSSGVPVSPRPTCRSRHRRPSPPFLAPQGPSGRGIGSR